MAVRGSVFALLLLTGCPDSSAPAATTATASATAAPTATASATTTATSRATAAPKAKPKKPAKKGPQASLLMWAPKGRQLAFTSEHGLTLLDVGDQALAARALCRNPGDHTRYSPDGTRIGARCSSKGDVGLFDAATGKELLAGPEHAFYARPWFNRTSSTLLITTGDGHVFYFDAKTGKERRAFQLDSFRSGMTASASVTFSPGEDELAAVLWDGGGVELWRGPAGKKVTKLDALSSGTASAQDLIWHPKGQMLLVIDQPVSGGLRMVDLKGKRMWDMKNLEQEALEASFRPDGKRLLVRRPKGQLDVMRVSSGAIDKTLSKSAMTASYSPGGEWVSYVDMSTNEVVVIKDDGTQRAKVFKGNTVPKSPKPSSDDDDGEFDGAQADLTDADVERPRPRWAGERLLVADRGKLHVLDPKTGKAAFAAIPLASDGVEVQASADAKVVALSGKRVRLVRLADGVTVEVTLKREGAKLTAKASSDFKL